MMRSALLGLLLPLAMGRKITVLNSCRQTVWPGIYANPGPMPDHETGWELKSGDSSSFEVSENWQSARVFGRTGCVMQDGKFDCLTGNCGSGAGGAGEGGSMLCTTTNMPATLAEFTLGDSQGNDHFDISHVDGFNLPMSITPSSPECADKSPKCTANINEVCPPMLRAGIDENGANGLCLSSCQAGFGDTPAGNRACCDGEYGQASDKCEPCGVDFYNVFKDKCPDAYVHAYDEYSLTALWQCRSEHKADYTIEFCPGGGSFIGPTKASEEYIDATATCEYKIPGGALVPRPSPTEGAPKSHLKVALSDGSAPNGGGGGGQSASSTQNGHGHTSGPASATSSAPPPAETTHQTDTGRPSGGNGHGNGDGDGRGNGGGNDDRPNGGNGNGGNRGNGGGNGNGNDGSSDLAINFAASDAISGSQTQIQSTSTSSSLSGQFIKGPTPHVDAPWASQSNPVNFAAGDSYGGGRKHCPARRRRRGSH